MLGLGSAVLGYLIGIGILSCVIGIIIYVNSEKYRKNIKKQAQHRIVVEDNIEKNQVQQNINTIKKCRSIQVGHVVDRDKFEEILNSNSQMTPPLADAIKYAIQNITPQERAMVFYSESQQLGRQLEEFLVQEAQTTLHQNKFENLEQETKKIMALKKFNIKKTNTEEIIDSEKTKFNSLLIKRKREREIGK